MPIFLQTILPSTVLIKSGFISNREKRAHSSAYCLK